MIASGITGQCNRPPTTRAAAEAAFRYADESSGLTVMGEPYDSFREGRRAASTT